MHIASSHFKNNVWSIDPISLVDSKKQQLVLLFGDKDKLIHSNFSTDLLTIFSEATCVFCSTSGEIVGTSVYNESIILTILSFNKSFYHGHEIAINDEKNSFEAGKKLAGKIKKDGLRHVLIFSDGGLINGSSLIHGLQSVLSESIPITGGLAGDGDHFQETVVGLNRKPEKGKVVAIALYGESLEINFETMSGWETFGPERIVTSANENVLFELDGNNALDLYKKYLGEYAENLPSSALLFPLSLKITTPETTLIRTILSIDFAEKSMLFAGNIPKGSTVRFMRANFDKLIDAARELSCAKAIENSENPVFALLISCVGRKLILNHRVDEEIESIATNLPTNTIISGFYSYGEIAPINNTKISALHNQTLTITTISEKV